MLPGSHHAGPAVDWLSGTREEAADGVAGADGHCGELWGEAGAGEAKRGLLTTGVIDGGTYRQ
jgi:hypothetical protein